MADNKNVIPNGLRASEMRNRMEDKNVLSVKGTMYVGTGIMGENGAAVTTFTPPPPSENTLLVKDDTQEGGLNWKNVGDVVNSAKTAGQIINANNADRADNVGDIVNNNQADSPVITFTIGDKSFNKTVNNVENANIATYASLDISKGTIEERLTKLGFKEGAVTPLPTSTCGNSSLKRQGNYIIGYIKEIKFSTADADALKLPDWAHPKEYLEMKQIAPTNVSSSGIEYQTIIITITQNGFVRTNKVPFATASIDIYFGYEANPL